MVLERVIEVHVTFKTESQKTTDKTTSVYLWAYENLWFLNIGIYLIASEHRVPVEEAEATAKRLLDNAESLYRKYENSDKGTHMTRRMKE